ncbi:hypothetical protein BS78_01G308000 [Paspalum vaginatum]|nr:hypothetical protein BS78_01G308000 [Paspalum vaginatum]
MAPPTSSLRRCSPHQKRRRAGTYLALMSRAELFMREDLGLTDEQVEVLSGSMNLFMLVSILAAGWAADSIGRRGTVVVANAFLMAGTLAMSLGGGYAALLAARFVTSVGVGFSVVVAPVYAAEIAPASSRGLLSSLVDFFITGGILLRFFYTRGTAGWCGLKPGTRGRWLAQPHTSSDGMRQVRPHASGYRAAAGRRGGASMAVVVRAAARASMAGDGRREAVRLGEGGGRVRRGGVGEK